MNTKIQRCSSKHLPLVSQILIDNDLPVDDLSNPHILFYAYWENEKIVGVIGLEIYDQTGLLRSLAVVKEYKGKGVGRQLVYYLLDTCKKNQMDQVFLLTTTADQYFLKHHFEEIVRDNVPDSIKQTSQFKDICPTSAVVMKKNIS